MLYTYLHDTLLSKRAYHFIFEFGMENQTSSFIHYYWQLWAKDRPLVMEDHPLKLWLLEGFHCYNRWTHTLNKWVTMAALYLVVHRHKVNTGSGKDTVLEGHEGNLRN